MSKKVSGLFVLIFMLPALVLGGCASADSDLIKAQRLLKYNADKYKNHEATGEIVDGVRVIHVKAWQFYFEPSTIVVNKGEKVKLIVESMDIAHGFEIEGFEIPDYDINTRIRKGFPLEIEFVADEVGVWQFICTIYCGFGHGTMNGTFVIR